MVLRPRDRLTDWRTVKGDAAEGYLRAAYPDHVGAPYRLSSPPPLRGRHGRVRTSARHSPLDRAFGAELRIDPLHWDGHRHVAVIGEIDLVNVREAEAVLAPMAKRGLHARPRLAGLTYCDSQGVAMIFRLAEQSRSTGGSLTIANPRGIVRHLFAVTHVPDIVTVVEEGHAVNITARVHDPANLARRQYDQRP